MALPPTYTNFVAPAIQASNLNEVNLVVYQLMGNGVDAPINDNEVKTNLGIPADIAAGDAATLAAATALTGRLINIQYITASGTYTPTAGTVKALVEGVGGGGGSGSTGVTAAGTSSACGGGGSGTWGRKLVLNPVAQAVTIGAGGAAAIIGGPGGNGTATVFGTMTLPGGVGSAGSGVAAAPVILGLPAAQAAPATGADVSITGGGGVGIAMGVQIGQAFSGTGGSNPLGEGGVLACQTIAGGLNGNSGTGFGSGASGPVGTGGAGAIAGTAGRPGILIIYEYS